MTLNIFYKKLITIFHFCFLIIWPYALCEAQLPKMREDPTDPARGGFKSLEVVPKPSCQSYDRGGNAVLNGRYDHEPATFNVISSSHKESELSVVFCLENENAGCVGNGLVLCFPAPPNAEFPVENLTEQQSLVQYRCGSKNGLVVSTEHDHMRGYFRIDTAYGNTYKFQIPLRKCFVLWLSYDTFNTKDRSISPENVFQTYENLLVTAIFKDNDVADMNSTEAPLEFSRDWKYVARDLKGKPIRMLWKEVNVWPSKNNSHSIISFTAQGGHECCALTGRIMGHYVLPCYHKWVQIGEECRARQPGHETECQIPYFVGKSNTTQTATIRSSSDGVSQSENNEHFQKFENTSYYYDRENSTDDMHNKTKLDITKLNSTLRRQDVNWGIRGNITIDGGATIKPVVLHVYATASADFNKTNNDDHLKYDDGFAAVHRTDGFNETQERINQTKLINETQKSSNDFMSSDRSMKSQIETETMLYIERYENHTAYNTVKWPDVLRVGQLHRICLGEKWYMNVIGDFTNNANVVGLATSHEIQSGYLNESVYRTCPRLPH